MGASGERVAIIGAGVGGLAAAIDLAGRGFQVTVLEAAGGPGGKLRAVNVAEHALDAGPTVFTMRDVFDGLFADAGASLNDFVRVKPLSVLARHAWDEERLDLFADVQQSAEAIGDFAGADAAQGYLAFCGRSREIFETLDSVFMRAQRPDPVSLAFAAAPQGLGRLWRISPFATLWQALGRYFPDPRLRQLFGRYATYCGSSPFEAPATLMLVAHAEQKGVWSIEGGMHRLAQGMAALARRQGADIRYDAPVAEVIVVKGRVGGLRLANEEIVLADIVISNADAAALATGALGEKAQAAVAKPSPSARSLSAVTWLTVAPTSGFPLQRHNVFFSPDYPAEFSAIAADRLPDDPTVYVCAQDRDDDQTSNAAPSGGERLLCLINAPACGDRRAFSPSEIEQCSERMLRRLSRSGLKIASAQTTVSTPADFNALYPATGGALYGRSSHGWMASFQRPGARSRLPGLYLAGGSAHPGPGVPMAAISGRLAAQCVMADLDMTSRSRRTAMRGGTSTR
jgi:1-hydroxycarotenoid 3,4-desaturase